MRYVELSPCFALRPWVKCIWLLESPFSHAPARERIVPDGCPEMIVHYGDCFTENAERGPATQPRAIMAGQLTRPLLVQPTGRVGMIAARFHPAGLARFLAAPLDEIADRRLPLDAVVGRGVPALVDHIGNAATDRERVHALESFLIEHLDRSFADAAGEPLRQCVATIMTRRGQVTMDQLTSLSQMSSRQLERRFRTEVGVSPKLLCRIVRFRGVFDLLQADTAWSIAALRCGYFDQAHLIRDFKHFAGQAPTAYLASQTDFARCFTQ